MKPTTPEMKTRKSSSENTVTWYTGTSLIRKRPPPPRTTTGPEA